MPRESLLSSNALRCDASKGNTAFEARGVDSPNVPVNPVWLLIVVIAVLFQQ